MAKGTWDQGISVTLYMERRHIEALDKLADEAGSSRQWMLRLILDEVLKAGSKIKVKAQTSAKITL